MSELHIFTHESISLFVIRVDNEILIEMLTVTMTSFLTDRVVWFCDAQMKTSYSSIHSNARSLYSRVWVSRIQTSSSVNSHEWSCYCFVTRIDDKNVDDLESLINVLSVLSENRNCQIICVSPQVTEIKSARLSHVRSSKAEEISELTFPRATRGLNLI